MLLQLILLLIPLTSLILNNALFLNVKHGEILLTLRMLVNAAFLHTVFKSFSFFSVTKPDNLIQIR